MLPAKEIFSFASVSQPGEREREKGGGGGGASPQTMRKIDIRIWAISKVTISKKPLMKFQVFRTLSSGFHFLYQYT